MKSLRRLLTVLVVLALLAAAGWWFTRPKPILVVVQEVGHVTTAFRMVEAGIGISIMPRLAIPPQGLPGLLVAQLQPQVQRAIMLVRRRQRELSPVAQRVWELIAGVAQGM